MSFGIKALKRVDKDLHSGHARQHISHVILGDDLAAVLKLVELKNKIGPENLRLITPRLLSRQVLLEQHACAVSTLRNNDVTLRIMERHPHVRTVNYGEETLFAKEGQWHRFGGRAKPMELLPGETHYLPPRQDLDLASLFSSADWEGLDDILNTYQHVRVLEKLEKMVPTDLVHKNEWWMLFHDLGEVTCEELWLSLPARLVLKATSQGQTLPPEAAAYLTSVKGSAAVAIGWECTQELHSGARTLFVPQSMTHEWGHFILDLHPWDAARGCYPVNALILIHDDEPTSEGMADKIKLCKRVLERVFPSFEQHMGPERIHASEDYLENPGDAALAESLQVSVPQLHLLGAYAPGPADALFLARALLNF